MVAETIFLILRNNANLCYLARKRQGRFKIFCVKRSVSDSKTIRKNNGEKSGSESSKMREKQILGP